MNLYLKLTSMFCTGIASTSLMLAQAAQTPKQQPAQKAMSRPVRARSLSSVSSTQAADGSQLLEICNVSYEVTGTDVPGLARDERLLPRTTTHFEGNDGDIGVDATILLEACRYHPVRLKPSQSQPLANPGLGSHRVGS